MGWDVVAVCVCYPHNFPSNAHALPPSNPQLPFNIKGVRDCRLDINIQNAVKVRTTVNTVHTNSWLCLAGADTHTHMHAHTHCGLSWATERSRGVLKLTNLYETNTIHTHTDTNTLTHTLSPRL